MTTHRKEYGLSRITISLGKLLNEQLVVAAATVKPGVRDLISSVVTVYYFKCLVFNKKLGTHVKKQENNGPYKERKLFNGNCPIVSPGVGPTIQRP